jgi:hypothetical protein
MYQTLREYVGAVRAKGLGEKEVAHTMYLDAMATGVSQADFAAALNQSPQSMKSYFDSHGVPFFAQGGLHSGGMRIVGEDGPELEVTGPARIFNASQTARMLSGGEDSATVQQLRNLNAALLEELSMLRAETRAIVSAVQEHLQLDRRMTKNGQSMPVTGVQNDPLKVEIAA